jgi:diguanylate cyclase (GGDEF)-like protein
MARSAAALFAAAATLALLSLAVPHGPDVDERTALITSVLGYPFAAALILGGDRVPRWVIHAILVTGTIMISIGVHTAGEGRMAGSASALYLWVALYAAYYFSWPAIAAHLVVVAAGYATVLVVDHVPAGPALWLGMTGTATVTAVVVASLAQRLRAQASTDNLTGLPNRRGWEMALERELARARRRASPLCVAVLDLDRFKELNDEQGHSAGDRVLKEVAATWLGLVRDSDVLARYGGDEFAVILPDCHPREATEIINRLCAANPGGSTCSAGVAWLEDGEHVEDLVDRADRALYRAKAAGGNRAATFVRDPEPNRG